MFKTKSPSRLLILAPVLFGVCCAYVVHAAQPDPIHIDPGQGTTLNVLLIGVFSMIATQIFNLIREYRNRKWDLQDRASAREIAKLEATSIKEEQKAKAEEIRKEIIIAAFELAQKTDKNRVHVLQELAKNTELTVQAVGKADSAYLAANNFNEKLTGIKDEIQGRAKQLDNMEVLDTDTNKKVTTIVDGVTNEKSSS